MKFLALYIRMQATGALKYQCTADSTSLGHYSFCCCKKHIFSHFLWFLMEILTFLIAMKNPLKWLNIRFSLFSVPPVDWLFCGPRGENRDTQALRLYVRPLALLSNF